MMEYEILTRNLKDSAANSKLKLLKEGEIFGVEKPGGEKRIYLGPISEEEEWDKFFFPKKNQTVNVTVQKIDLIKYLIEAKDEFFNPQQSYRLKISEFYDSLFQQTLNIPDESFQICFEKNTDSKRYYLTRPSKSPLFKNYNYIIDICLPIVTIFVFLRIKNEDSYIYYLRPEFKLDYTTPDIINNDSTFGDKLQQIFYGAPGTGKSNTIKCEVDDKGLPNIRTTFHPDTDYSTFVGAYKPTSIDVPVMTMIGTKAVPVENSDGTPRMEKKIVYEFVPQAFLKAYAEAWKNQDEPFFLIIEEINRGNCAQIFGDLFQLLDRNDETGLSDYPISPDEDIRKFLQTDKKYGFAALTEEQKAAIPEKVLSGEWMILPGNLHIWATMNTSDQSLFPIDSAFKRRWDWQYMPISDGGKGWQIEVNGKRYDWWEFVQKINNKIGFTTNSEDKKLGYYFCKAKNGVIDAETFVGKVFFYIWNDVFKDFAEEAGDLFKDSSDTENPLLSFNKFYTVGLDGKTKVVEDKVELFLQNLEVEQIDALDSNFDNENDENDNEKVRLTVKFPNGELIACETKFDSYIAALRKIGLERVEQVAAEKKYQRHGCALISRSEEQGILDATDYSYMQEQGFYIVKGINGRTMRNMLNLLSQRLNLQLEVVYE